MEVEIIGQITGIEVIARGSSVRESARLRKLYGGAVWRKMKGVAKLRLKSGIIETAEIHWYDSHGVGRVETKIKRFVKST